MVVLRATLSAQALRAEVCATAKVCATTAPTALTEQFVNVFHVEVELTALRAYLDTSEVDVASFALVESKRRAPFRVSVIVTQGSVVATQAGAALAAI
jgi:hypothetical protein